MKHNFSFHRINSNRPLLPVLFMAGLFSCQVGSCQTFAPDDATASAESKLTSPFNADQIRDAFRRTHDGVSSDELILCDERRNAFLQALSIAPHDPKQADRQKEALLKLLQIRKQGELNVPTTRRAATPRGTDGKDPIATILPIAEVAIRTILDRHEAMIDDVLCDPRWRTELQREAETLSAGVDAETVRRAVLRLRKTRRLRPELVLRVADWDRVVTTHSVKEMDLESLPNTPGVYLFRDASGYLYIGEAIRLRDRITEHLDGTHNAGLAAALNRNGSGEITLELHAFPADSPAKKVTVRRAYESELIRSRHPKFNLRP